MVPSTSLCSNTFPFLPVYRYAFPLFDAMIILSFVLTQFYAICCCFSSCCGISSYYAQLYYFLSCYGHKSEKQQQVTEIESYLYTSSLYSEIGNVFISWEAAKDQGKIYYIHRINLIPKRDKYAIIGLLFPLCNHVFLWCEENAKYFEKSISNF